MKLMGVQPYRLHTAPGKDINHFIKMDRIALKTMQGCMQKGYEDRPKRDRRLWIGDLKLQAQTSYVTFHNNNLVKHDLYLYAGLTMNISFKYVLQGAAGQIFRMACGACPFILSAALFLYVVLCSCYNRNIRRKRLHFCSNMTGLKPSLTICPTEKGSFMPFKGD